MQPRYVRIAIDLAESIVDGNLQVGTLISGRSVLASRYNVSPETIRKAVALLKDYQVVSSSPKKGIVILNETHASQFLKDIRLSQRYNDVKTHLENLLEQQRVLNLDIQKQLTLLLELKKRPIHANRYFPYDLTVPDHSHLIGQTVSESHFWHRTTATIIYVTRQDKTFVSPGPDFKFKGGDILFFVCQDKDYHLARSFIETKKQ